MLRRAYLSGCAAALCLALTAGGLVPSSAFAKDAVPAKTDASASVELSYRTYPKFAFRLPAGQMQAVKDTIPIPHKGGSGFAVKLDGTDLLIDDNGDGETNLVVRRKDKESALVRLKGEREDGSKFTYALRLHKRGTWSFHTSGAMEGTVGDIKVRLIDQNHNGRYNDLGEDAVLVGDGSTASFLSPVWSVDGALKLVSVSSDGSRISLKPYKGKTGTIDMTSAFVSDGRLTSAIVKSTTGAFSFDVAALANETSSKVELPIGSYALIRGTVTKGTQSVTIEPGDMKPVKVRTDKHSTIAWGGPLRAEFTFKRAGDKMQFSPKAVWYFGGAGEQYSGWTPKAKSPEFIVTRKDNGEEIVRGKFMACT